MSLIIWNINNNKIDFPALNIADYFKSHYPYLNNKDFVSLILCINSAYSK